MIPVYICEDIEKELQIISKMINEIIVQNELQESVEVVCAVQDPLEILAQIKRDIRPGIYFLDVDLGKAFMNGIELGVNIKILDPAAYIIMVTTHAESAPLTFEYKIGAKDYILKDRRHEEIIERVSSNILRGYEFLSKAEKEETKIILLRKDYLPFTMYSNQIYYIEVVANTQRKSRVHEQYSFVEITSTLQETKKQLNDSFFQCHRSYIVNLHNIKKIDSKKRIVIMKNGKEIPVSFRSIRALEKRYLELLINE